MRPRLLFVFWSALPCCVALKGGGDRADVSDTGVTSDIDVMKDAGVTSDIDVMEDAGAMGDATVPSKSDSAQESDAPMESDALEESDATEESDAVAEFDALPDCALRHPPPPPDSTDAAGASDGATSVTSDRIFAISSTYFGSRSTDAGGPDFETIGFDLDNTCTGANGCVEPPWANSIHGGVDGIDNAYGELIQNGFPNSVDASASAANILFRIHNYSGAPDEDPVDVSIYVALGLMPRADGGVGPFWDGNDRWTILPEFLIDPGDGAAPSVDQPRFHADRAYVTGGVLVARFDKTLAPGGLTNVPRLLVTAHQLTIAGKIAPVDDAGARWELQDLVVGYRVSLPESLTVAALTPNLAPPDGAPNQLYCQDEASYDSFKQDLCSLADVATDPNAPRSARCDAMSVGLLFQAQEALLGDIAGPAPPLPACSPGVHLGTDTCDTLLDQ